MLTVLRWLARRRRYAASRVLLLRACARACACNPFFPVTLVTVSNPGYSLVLYVQRLRSLLRFEAGQLQSFSVLASFNNGNLMQRLLGSFLQFGDDFGLSFS